MYFVFGAAEKAEPILDLVEGLGEEDQVGTIFGRGFDVHSSEFDTFAVYQLRL